MTRSIILGDILPAFLITRGLLALIARLSSYVIVKSQFYGKPKVFLDLFYKWDARWFMGVIDKGYYYVPGGKTNLVFFPLYPLLVKAATRLVGNAQVAGLLISNAALFVGLVFLHKLIRLDGHDREAAARAVLYVLIFPASLFFSIFYSEGLFFGLAVAAFYYARRKKWLAASILGFFLSLTRSIGVFIVIPLAIEYLEIDFSNFRLDLKKLKPDVLWLLLVPAGLGSYMAFLYFRFHDPLLFIKAHGSWGRKVTTLWDTLLSFSTFPTFYRLIFLGTLILVLMLIVYAFAIRLRLSYIVFVLIDVLVIMSSGLLESFPRYMAVLFPLYLVLALWTAKNKAWASLWTFLSFSILVLFTVLFVNGYWMT